MDFSVVKISKKNAKLKIEQIKVIIYYSGPVHISWYKTILCHRVIVMALAVMR